MGGLPGSLHLGEVSDSVLCQEGVVKAVPAQLHGFGGSQAHGHLSEAVHVDEIIDGPRQRTVSVAALRPHLDRARLRRHQLGADAGPFCRIEAIRVRQPARPQQGAHFHGLFVAETRPVFAAFATRARVVLRHQPDIGVGKQRPWRDELIVQRL